jgi:hypothetical protein
MRFGFGRSFVRGFGWGLGRGLAYEETRPRYKRQKRMKKSQPKVDMRVLGWIDEALEAYKAIGRTDPTFEGIQLYVKQHHHYMLTR